MNEQQLVLEIEKHNSLYLEDNSPEISDEQYDELIQQLEELNPDHLLLSVVGSAGVASLGKVQLNEPMISLDKIVEYFDTFCVNEYQLFIKVHV